MYTSPSLYYKSFEQELYFLKSFSLGYTGEQGKDSHSLGKKDKKKQAISRTEVQRFKQKAEPLDLATPDPSQGYKVKNNRCKRKLMWTCISRITSDL